MTGNDLIRISGLGRAFPGPNGPVEVLRDIDLTIPRGSFTVIRGPSGAGKTTLLRILGLLDAEYSGTVHLAGTNLAMLGDADRDELRTAATGFVFQDGRLLPHLTLGENIALPVLFTRQPAREATRSAAEAAAFAFRPEERAAGVCGLRPGAASGGQRQRAALARAMIRQPALILADEPTASLDAASKAQVIDRLCALHAAGATVVVVSHDEALFGIGRQFLLEAGCLVALSAPAEDTLKGRIEPSLPASKAPLGGWWPRLGPRRLLAAALRDLLRRPMFALLMLIAVVASTAQTAVFASLVAGLDRLVERTIADGSRLTRVTLKPRKADAGTGDHFPEQANLAAALDVAAAVARRATTVSVRPPNGESRPFPTLGLHPGDPELGMFRFVAGAGFGDARRSLDMIATTEFLIDLFGAPEDGGAGVWNRFIGRQVSAEIPRFGRSGKQVGAEPLVLTITGVILKGEGDRQFYLPNDLLVAIDAIKRDRTGKLSLPLTADRSAWAPGADLAPLLNWPWQDMLHLYLHDIDAVVPKIAALSGQGYRPEAEIWKYAWMLDMKSAAYGIVAPLLVLLSGVVGAVLFGNIVISARLREAELALMKVLGMRRGDILATELIGTLLTSNLGMAVGFAIADRLTAALVRQLQTSARLAAELTGEAHNDRIGLLFQPVWTIAPPIAAATLGLVLLGVLWPTLRAAGTDPAQVFTRN